MYIRAVKFVAVILSIYILVLNITPCDDEPTSLNAGTTEISYQLQDDHSHNEADLCSPFCHCSCCQVVTMELKSSVFEPLQLPFSKENFFLPERQTTNFLGAILQPPRV